MAPKRLIYGAISAGMTLTVGASFMNGQEQSARNPNGEHETTYEQPNAAIGTYQNLGQLSLVALTKTNPPTTLLMEPLFLAKNTIAEQLQASELLATAELQQAIGAAAVAAEMRATDEALQSFFAQLNVPQTTEKPAVKKAKTTAVSESYEGFVTNPDLGKDEVLDPELDARFDRLAVCESGGNWHINTGNGYKGGIQFDDRTWLSNGGDEFAPHADLATPRQQKLIGQRVQQARGWGPWPGCTQGFGWEQN